MAAYSKAGKLKAKRGRPKKEGVIREANGRASRAKEPPARTALQARMNHTGMTLLQAQDPRAGTYIGRLAMLGSSDGLSDDQYDAAIRYRTLRNEYRKALHSQGAHYEAGQGIDDPEAYQKWAKAVIERYKLIKDAVRDEQNRTRSLNLYAALEHVIVEDLPLDYMIGSVRVVCNVLSKHFMNVDRTKKVRNK